MGNEMLVCFSYHSKAPTSWFLNAYLTSFDLGEVRTKTAITITAGSKARTDRRDRKTGVMSERQVDMINSTDCA
jgi:hypothetical protein